jgi:enoyl-CoA hydratase/carnithine racemase
VRLEVSGAVATIRLDRPKMNAVNAQLRDELAEAARSADADPAVRAVILYGGERVFAAGSSSRCAPTSGSRASRPRSGSRRSSSASSPVPEAPSGCRG